MTGGGHIAPPRRLCRPKWVAGVVTLACVVVMLYVSVDSTQELRNASQPEQQKKDVVPRRNEQQASDPSLLTDSKAEVESRHRTTQIPAPDGVPDAGSAEFAPATNVWLRRHALAPSSFNDGYSLRLSDAALASVQRGPVRMPCPPDRFVFVNTHTFGRHHNQLQEMLNIVAWARTLNRTAVMGWFRHDHKWTPMDALYNFEQLQAAGYCLVRTGEFARLWRERANKNKALGEATAVCVGQGVKDTPLKSIVRKCKMLPGVPAHYDSRFGVDSTKTFLGIVRASDVATSANFLGLSGEMGFFMRPGLLEQVAIGTRVRMLKEIEQEATRFASFAGLTSSLPAPAAPPPALFESPATDPHTAIDIATKQPRGLYFALHLRQREKECMKEMNNSFTDGTVELALIDHPDLRRSIEGQCAITVPWLDRLLDRLDVKVIGRKYELPPQQQQQRAGEGGGGGARDVHYRVFLASDHQSVELEKALVSRNAIMYEGGIYHTRELGGLHGLGVDFVMLQRAARFTGNQLSSVSQNACFFRLGKGLPCDGFVPDFTLYHSRNVDPEIFSPNLVWG